MGMLGYVTIGTNDLEAATAFYDTLLKPLGGAQVHAFARGVFYGAGDIELAILQPFNGEQAEAGNGNMVALKAPSRAVVDEVHALALSLGGTDDGAPGIRGRESSGFYGAYCRDPEGNKLCIFRRGPDE